MVMFERFSLSSSKTPPVQLASHVQMGFDLVGEALRNVAKYRLNKSLKTKLEVDYDIMGKKGIESDGISGRLIEKDSILFKLEDLGLDDVDPKACYDDYNHEVFYGWKVGKVLIYKSHVNVSGKYETYYISRLRADGSVKLNLAMQDVHLSTAVHGNVLAHCLCNDLFVKMPDKHELYCVNDDCSFSLAEFIRKVYLPNKEGYGLTAMEDGLIRITDPYLGEYTFKIPDNYGEYGIPNSLINYVTAVMCRDDTKAHLMDMGKATAFRDFINNRLSTSKSIKEVVVIDSEDPLTQSDMDCPNLYLVCLKDKVSIEDIESLNYSYSYNKLYVPGNIKFFEKLNKKFGFEFPVSYTKNLIGQS